MIYSNKKKRGYPSFSFIGLNLPFNTSFLRISSRLITSSTSSEEGAALQISAMYPDKRSHVPFTPVWATIFSIWLVPVF
nr:MAG TPA: hypothetical protein [Caudoviricetes sp.]DAE79980.1 MAG TPA: hypothetical protein [Caudoviricetes sp.]